MQSRQHFYLRLAINPAKFSKEPGFVHRPDLIEHNLTPFPLKLAGNSCRVPPPPRRHRCNDYRADVAIHLIGRDDQTRPAFLDFAANCRVKTDQKHVEARDYHCHSSSSQRV